MRASQLTEWVDIFLMDVVADGAGGTRESIPPDLPVTVPAHVEEISGSEQPASDQISDRVRYRITVRWEPGIATSMHRVLWRDMYLDVISVRNVDLKDTWYELTCERKEQGMH